MQKSDCHLTTGVKKYKSARNHGQSILWLILLGLV